MTLFPLQPTRSTVVNAAGQAVDDFASAGCQRVGARRVLHVINGEHYSGAERVQDLLAARLPEVGFDVGFACVKPDKFPRARQAQSAKLHDTSMRSKWDVRAATRVAHLVRAEGYSLLHSHTPRSALVARLAAARTGVPMIYHVHSPTSRDSTHRLRNLVNHWLERLSLTSVPAIVTVSNSLRQHMLSQGFHANRVFTVPNGVPLPSSRRSAKPPTGTWTLGMTALFRPRKGLEVLLDAMAILRQSGILVRFHAVGPFESPQYECEIRLRIARLGVGDSITWTGFTSDVSAELNKMDLFVLPSLFGEGLPMVVLEAMAAGVPVVATKVEGVPEAIEHGVSGVLVNPNDPVDLGRSIAAAIRGEFGWNSLREGALLRHAEEFSDIRMATRLAEIYHRVLQR